MPVESITDVSSPAFSSAYESFRNRIDSFANLEIDTIEIEQSRQSLLSEIDVRKAFINFLTHYQLHESAREQERMIKNLKNSLEWIEMKIVKIAEGTFSER